MWGPVLVEGVDWGCVDLVRFMFWKVSMRRSVRLEVFDVEIRDLDMFRCGGLSFWMSLIGDVWFWLD